jgi:tRNA threonylcarbamoyladenosine modification (KEOPS) complex Cgi121 subunit
MAVSSSFELHDGSKCTVMYAKAAEAKDFLETLRSEFPNVSIQIVADDAAYDVEHLKWAIRQSWLAKDRGVMLAKRVELDLLMRIAAASQISEALKIAGAKANRPFYIVGVSVESELKKLADFVRERCKLLEFKEERNKKVLQRFGIDESEIDAIGNDKIALLLAEKGLLAIVEKL